VFIGLLEKTEVNDAVQRYLIAPNHAASAQVRH